MADGSNKPDLYDRKAKTAKLDELSRIDERRFSQKLEELIQESEAMRMRRMKQHRARTFIAMNMSILSVVAGTAGAGWYFLWHVHIGMSVFCLILSLFPAVLLYLWAGLPIMRYKSEHKTIFMPKLAKALNGLTYHPQRGVNPKIMERLAVMPAHSIYKAEDCFMGMYKGVKVIFSEARLYAKSTREDPVFEGIFVLLEIPAEVIEGHTVITANTKMVKDFAQTRWKTMQRVFVSPSNPEWDKFEVYSTKPETAELIVGDRLLKELSEAAAIFKNSPLTAVLFGKKFVFLMIPYDQDMFEASDLYVPVATQQHALNCKHEIEQILEIIDVFDLYKPLKE
jgi:Protein of unknown function (DUF3137)